MIVYLNCDIEDIARVELPSGQKVAIISVPDSEVQKLRDTGLVHWVEGDEGEPDWGVCVFGHEPRKLVASPSPIEEEKVTP